MWIAYDNSGNKMEEEDQATFERHHTLCTSLNMDRAAADDAWKSYVAMRQNYTLEGDQLHWLCCALYVACRRVQTPTVGDPPVFIEGNLVSLTRLLRQCNLSLVQFFNKCRKWADMANLSQEFRAKFDHLERKFEVSMVIFKKYQTMFHDIFNKRTAEEEVYQHKSKKIRNALCSTSKVFDFCWTLFVTIKGSYPAVADDLVNSYHLLLACCDLIYLNALLANRRDLLNPNFSGLPSDYHDIDYTPPTEAKSIIDVLCERHDGVSKDAMSIQQYCWNNQMKKLFDKGALQGKVENLTSLLDTENFDINFKAINKVYDEYALSVGEFDERIFLSDEASEDIGAPTDADVPEVNPNGVSKVGADYSVRQLAPPTPLTNRRWLRNEKEIFGQTPLSSATQSVTRLINLLERREECVTVTLRRMFQFCPDDTQDKMEKILKQLGEKFVSKYNQLNDQQSGTVNFAEERLSLAKKLFYKVLEGILQYEEKLKPSINISSVLNQEVHQCLFACCLEIIVFTYNSHRTFPWVLETLNIEPYSFYRIIEIVLRVEDQLPRDTVKHLSMIEEKILESLAWQSGSPLWNAINQPGVQVPKCEDVFLSNQLMDENDFKAVQSSIGSSVFPKVNNSSQSPGASLMDRFSSPVVSRQSDINIRTVKPGQSVLQSKQPTIQTSTFKPTSSKDETVAEKKPKKTGSISIFFRKFYSLASVRMQDLCMRLRIVDIGLMKKIWTCFEYAITYHNLMQDRHLDQILMCSIYVICKVVHTDEAPTERTFGEIMKCYRFQPQAASHVYRSVLLWKKLPADNPSSGELKIDAYLFIPSLCTRHFEIQVLQTDGLIEAETWVFYNNKDIKTEGPSDVPTAPLTPNNLAGTSNSFDNVERGDLIKFYNSVYVIVVQSFVKMFPSNQKEKSDQKLRTLLSPLPRGRLTPKSPMRRVSQKHSLYIRPFDSKTNLTPGSQALTFCVNRSPAKDLRAINKMIKGEVTKGVKRSLTDFDEVDSPPTVLPSADAACNKRIQNVLEDRIGQSHCAK